jgi:hypothetical protein
MTNISIIFNMYNIILIISIICIKFNIFILGSGEFKLWIYFQNIIMDFVIIYFYFESNL